MEQAKLEAAQVDRTDHRTKTAYAHGKIIPVAVTVTRIEILPATRSTRPLSGLGISTVNPRSRDLTLSLFHPSTTLTLPSTFINLFHLQTSIH
jgi:hypothetical protein